MQRQFVQREFVSTRDPAEEVSSFSESVVNGLGKFGGLMIPKAGYTKLGTTDLKAIADAKYTALVGEINGLLGADELPPDDLRQMIDDAYSLDNFPDTVAGNLVPVREVEEDLFICNLSNGPTAAFKDIPMQLMARQMAKILGYNGKTKNLLGGTSGDTGSAAEAAFKLLEQITHLFMLSPIEGMSDFQRWQMGELSGDNIYNISIEGNFDDCQKIVKDLQEDENVPDFGAVNSINWGRVAAQVPYYFAAYFQVIAQKGLQVGDQVDVVVPSGNFGNILAGHIARKLGLPIRVLVAATNENNTLHRLIQTGDYYAPRKAGVTSSPSMDITKASNYERVVYEDVFHGDPKLTAKYMGEFNKRRFVSFDEFGIAPDRLKQIGFDSGVADDEDRLITIKWLWEKRKDMIDPHTATGVAVAKRRLQDQRERGEKPLPTIVMETALPVKFRDTIHKAIGREPIVPARFTNIYNQTAKLPENAFKVLPANSKKVANYILEVMAA